MSNTKGMTRMGTRSGPDTMILDAYRSCGWKHQGFDTGYGKVVNRWNWIRTFDGIKDEKTLLAPISRAPGGA